MKRPYAACGFEPKVFVINQERSDFIVVAVVVVAVVVVTVVAIIKPLAITMPSAQCLGNEYCQEQQQAIAVVKQVSQSFDYLQSVMLLSVWSLVLVLLMFVINDAIRSHFYRRLSFNIHITPRNYAAAPAMDTAMCSGNGYCHVPYHKQKLAQGGKMYFLFTAAEHGCVACVKQLIEEEGVNANSQSLHNKYTALDFAEWFAKKGKNPTGCEEVAQYLRPRTRSRSTKRKIPAKEEEAAASGEMSFAYNAE